VKKEDKIDSFRLALLISFAVHFSLILVFPGLRVPIPRPPKYFEVSLIRVIPKPISTGRVIKAEEVKKPVRVEKMVVSELPTLEIKTSGQPEEALPVLPPYATPESEMKISPSAPEPGIPLERGVEPSFYLPQFLQERKTVGVERGVSEEGSLPPRVSLPPPREEISYKGKVAGAQPEAGEATVRIKGPLGTRGIVRLIEPVYPQWAEERGIEGSVELRPWVLPSGDVRPDVEILQSSGWLELDECAREVLRQWRFESIEGDEIQGGESSVEFIFTFK